jgi:hypothetical protein
MGMSGLQHSVGSSPRDPQEPSHLSLNLIFNEFEVAFDLSAVELNVVHANAIELGPRHT